MGDKELEILRRIAYSANGMVCSERECNYGDAKAWKRHVATNVDIYDEFMFGDDIPYSESDMLFLEVMDMVGEITPVKDDDEDNLNRLNNLRRLIFLIDELENRILEITRSRLGYKDIDLPNAKRIVEEAKEFEHFLTYAR